MRFWTTKPVSLPFCSSSARFMPSPVTLEYATSGRWLTHELIRSRIAPPAGKNSRYTCVTAAIAPSSMCVTRRGLA